MQKLSTILDVGENRFAVYVAGLPMPELRQGWIHLYKGFLLRTKVSVLKSPKRLLTKTEADEWKDAIRAFDPGVSVTIFEFTPVPQMPMNNA